MKITDKNKFLGLFLILVFLLTPGVHAAITLEPDFSGTVILTLPDGEIAFLEPGDRVPEIPSGSQIEVIEGSATIRTEEGDSATIALIDHDVVVENGSSVTVEDQGVSATLKVLKGQAELIDFEGGSEILQTGSQRTVGIEELEQPFISESAATDRRTGPLGEDTGDTQGPDPRGIEVLGAAELLDAVPFTDDPRDEDVSPST